MAPTSADLDIGWPATRAMASTASAGSASTSGTRTSVSSSQQPARYSAVYPGRASAEHSPQPTRPSGSVSRTTMSSRSPVVPCEARSGATDARRTRRNSTRSEPSLTAGSPSPCTTAGR